MHIQKLKQNFKGEIDSSDKTREVYSHDASIFEVVPEVVVHPQDTEDVKNLVRFVAEEKKTDPSVSITARSAGTDMSGGAVNDSIIADFTTHFRTIGAFHENSVVVQPGVYYRDFEKRTLEKGLILPCYTASKSLNTVGGMAANNSAGEKSLTYGQTKDYVETLSVVLSDGNEYTFGPLSESELEAKLKVPGFEGQIYRETFRLIKSNYELIQKARPTTSKNAAGYYLWEVWDKKTFNLAKLLVGSQGTLGLITEIKFRLVKPNPKNGLLVIFLKDLSILGKVVKRVLEFKPETFESYDNHTFRLAVKFLPGMIRRMKGNVISLGLSFLPELWLTLTGGIPKLVVIAEFTGADSEEISQKISHIQEVIEKEFPVKTHKTKNEQESEKYWTVRRESFSLLREHSKGLSTAPFIDDIVVKPDQLPEFLPELNAILDKYKSLVYTIAGHAGDANFHIIPLMDLSREDQRAIIPILADEVYGLVLKYGGSIDAEHNDGLIRTPYLEKMFGREMVELFAQVKNIFDPENIFNPRKKVGGDLEYTMSHIKKH